MLTTLLWPAALLLGILAHVGAAPLLERQSGVPAYVLSYAPVVWLSASERYFPSDLAAQLAHTHPTINRTPVSGAPSPLTLDNLDSLNALGGASIYLSSNDDFTATPPPSWLLGVKPDASGKTNGATSCVVVTHDKGNGIVDAYYFYFYAYNQGNIVFGSEAGDHVGDWEHNMVRFSNGVPQSLWYSQHSDGEAFTYAATQKRGIRPVTYSAVGSHANYAIAGKHDHTIPGLNLPFSLLLVDNTDAGTLWDPVANAYFYRWTPDPNGGPGNFEAYGGEPTAYLSFLGQWGDDELPSSDPRQSYVLGIKNDVTAKYTGGPTGPEAKDLDRANVCPDSDKSCVVRPVLTAK